MTVAGVAAGIGLAASIVAVPYLERPVASAPTPTPTHTATLAPSISVLPTVAVSPSASPSAAPLRIMPLGDSITYGVGSLTHSSYRIDLAKRLAESGLTVDYVGSQQSGIGADRDNEGHPGWSISEITAQVGGWLRTYQPDVVLLHIGTNDMNQNLDVAQAPARLAVLINQIRLNRPYAEIFVQELVGARSAVVQGRIDAYNAAIPGVVAALGPRVHAVDQSMDDWRMLSDRLHPNDNGYATMSANLYQALAKVYHLARPQ
jgi:lysophospholipase L1-like esterase